MINLIPPEGHKVVKQEYILRVGATLCFLFGGVFIILAVALSPIYILVDAQIKALALITEDEIDKENMYKTVAGEIQVTKDILTRLDTEVPNITASLAIDTIQKLTPSGIVFRTFFVEDSDGVIERIQIQGIASTREKLAELKNIIESSDLFKSVDIPISDLARDRELPFAITITLEEEN